MMPYRAVVEMIERRKKGRFEMKMNVKLFKPAKGHAEVP